MEINRNAKKHLDSLVQEGQKQAQGVFLPDVSIARVTVTGVVGRGFHIDQEGTKYFIGREENNRGGPLRTETEIEGLCHDETVGDKFHEIICYHAIQEFRYGQAGFANPHELATNDMVLYTMKFFDPKDQQEFYSWMEADRVERTDEIQVHQSNSIAVHLNGGKQSWKEYNLIPMNKETRRFFPRGDFTLQTDVGEIKTHVTKSGDYITKGMKPFFKAHSELATGDVLVVSEVRPGEVYKLNIKGR